MKRSALMLVSLWTFVARSQEGGPDEAPSHRQRVARHTAADDDAPPLPRVKRRRAADWDREASDVPVHRRHAASLEEDAPGTSRRARTEDEEDDVPVRRSRRRQARDDDAPPVRHRSRQVVEEDDATRRVERDDEDEASPPASRHRRAHREEEYPESPVAAGSVEPEGKAEPPHVWSAISGHTVGEGRGYLHVELGYPGGVQATLYHGGSDTFDIGGRWGIFYSSEGVLGANGIGPRAQLLLRWMLVNAPHLWMSLQLEPGVFAGFGGGDNPVHIGVVVPIRYVVGFPLSRALALHVGVDVPLYFDVFAGFSAPILLGGGLEYFLNDSVSLTARVRIGPSFQLGSTEIFENNPVTIGADATIGIAFHT